MKSKMRPFWPCLRRNRPGVCSVTTSAGQLLMVFESIIDDGVVTDLRPHQRVAGCIQGCQDVGEGSSWAQPGYRPIQLGAYQPLLASGCANMSRS